MLLKLRDCPDTTNFGRGKDQLVAGLHGVEQEAVLDFEFVCAASGVRTNSTTLRLLNRDTHQPWLLSP